MKIVVFGATGRIGRALVHEALVRNHHVLAVSRNPAPESFPADVRLSFRIGDLLDPVVVRSCAAGSEALISAFGPGQSGTPKSIVHAVESVIAGLRDSSCSRFLMVGGAGSLKVDEHTMLIDTPQFPSALRPVTEAHRHALELLRAEGDGLEWSCLSPPARIEPGARTGSFRLGNERLIVRDDGVSLISFADYAVAMIDELERPEHVRARFTVGY